MKMMLIAAALLMTTIGLQDQTAKADNCQIVYNSCVEPVHVFCCCQGLKDRLADRKDQRADRREDRREDRLFDFAGSFGRQRQMTQELQGSMRELIEANRLANADRQRLMDRLSEFRQERQMFEQELAGFRSERNGILNMIKQNRAERQLEWAKQRDAIEKQMVELAKAKRDRDGIFAKLGIAYEDNSRLFARQRAEFAPLKNMVSRLTSLVWVIMGFLGSLALLALLVMYLWSKAKSKVGM